MDNERHGAAVQFYNQELNTISQRNTAFLIVQSILIAAFATLLVNADKFPWALAMFMWALSVAGSLFCLFHHVAGRSGARTASNWRRYMRLIESGQINAPWNRFDQYCDDDEHAQHIKIPKKSQACLRLRNLYFGLQCDRCLVQRLPLPHIWIITPAIFASGWVLSAVYMTVRLLFLKQDPLRLHPNPYLSLPVATGFSFIVLGITLAVLVKIIQHGITWWHTTIPES